MKITKQDLFFRNMMLSMLAVVVIFFPANVLVNGFDSVAPMRPILHVHAVSLGAWFLLGAIQSSLIQTGKTHVHRILGQLSVLLVIIMLPVGIYVSMENAQRTGSNSIFYVNLTSVAIFLVHYGTALFHRGIGEWHKRMMVFASLSIMLPAFARVTYTLQIGPYFALPMWIAFIVAIIVHDKRQLGYVTKATYFGLILTAIQIAILMSIGPPPE